MELCAVCVTWRCSAQWWSYMDKTSQFHNLLRISHDTNSMLGIESMVSLIYYARIHTRIYSLPRLHTTMLTLETDNTRKICNVKTTHVKVKLSKRRGSSLEMQSINSWSQTQHSVGCNLRTEDEWTSVRLHDKGALWYEGGYQSTRREVVEDNGSYIYTFCLRPWVRILLFLVLGGKSVKNIFT